VVAVNAELGFQGWLEGGDGRIRPRSFEGGGRGGDAAMRASL
jgi:hypothetical protein